MSVAILITALLLIGFLKSTSYLNSMQKGRKQKVKLVELLKKHNKLQIILDKVGEDLSSVRSVASQKVTEIYYHNKYEMMALVDVEYITATESGLIVNRYYEHTNVEVLEMTKWKYDNYYKKNYTLIGLL